MSVSEYPFDADVDQCAHALQNAHAFLHGELSSEAADIVRQHLMACERCLDEFQVEELINALLKRCCSDTQTPDALRARLSALSVQAG
ncbi:MAG: zf-HC2 domain-containing protein [Propionibacteriaceae bacterium]|jgi:anti-sigma factor (TIGR02949 family)|nr:zf-HC2 domain-containing protein [Propionibacteriaceae bacterium]